MSLKHHTKIEKLLSIVVALIGMKLFAQIMSRWLTPGILKHNSPRKKASGCSDILIAIIMIVVVVVLISALGH